MNPGAAEEAGKTANLFMTIMKDQPLSLALAIMNIALLVIFWMILDRVGENRKFELQMIFDEHKEVRELLAKCVIPKASRHNEHPHTFAVNTFGNNLA